MHPAQATLIIIDTGRRMGTNDKDVLLEIVIIKYFFPLDPEWKIPYTHPKFLPHTPPNSSVPAVLFPWQGVIQIDPAGSATFWEPKDFGINVG